MKAFVLVIYYMLSDGEHRSVLYENMTYEECMTDKLALKKDVGRVECEAET